MRDEPQSGAKDAARHALHELCQPLTRLQWRLEVGHRLGDEATLRETVEGSLEDARELSRLVHHLRQHLVGSGVERQAEIVQ